MKARFFALMALVLGLASCQNDFDGVKQNAKGEVNFQLTVAAPDLGATRAGENGMADDQQAFDSAFGAIDYLQGAVRGDERLDWGDVDLRYTLEVYDKADDYTDAKPIKDRMVIIKDSYETVKFELRLVPNRDYHFVIFADFVEEGLWQDTNLNEGVDYQRDLGKHHIIGETLADITITEDGINDECTDAYFATKDIRVSNAAPQEIVLKRPYGKLRVIATDLAELNLNVEPAKVKVAYTAKHPATFNALTGEIEETVETEFEYVYDYESIYKEIYKEVDKGGLQNHFYTAGYDNYDNYGMINDNGVKRHTHMTLFTDYILAKDDQTAYHFEMEVYDTNGELIKATEFATDIPVQRNYLTTVIGNVLTTATDIEVRIDDNFAGYNYFNLWDGKSATMPEYDAETKTYLIREASELAWFAAQVNGTTRAAANTFKGYTVKLVQDIHLNGERWNPIGATGLFEGTFDGNGHTIQDLFVYETGKASAGLFATSRGLIKNLRVVNAEIYGQYKAAVIVADGLCSRVEGCEVNRAVVLSTPYNKNDANNVGAIVGYLSGEPTAYVKDCIVKNAEITAYRKVGGVVGAANRAAEVSGNKVYSTVITADMTAEYSEVHPADIGYIVGWAAATATVSDDNTPAGGINTANSDAVYAFVKVKDAAGINQNSDVSVVLPAGEYNLTEDVKSQSIHVQGDVEITAGKIETGTPNQYGFVAAGEDTSLTINAADINSLGGGIGASDGAQVTFNDGKLAVNSASTSGRYLIYAVGEGTVVTVNGGEFSFSKTLNQKRAYVYCGAGAKVIINAGTFGKASERSGYTDGILGDGETIIYGGTFGFNPTKWVAPGYEAVKEGQNWVVKAFEPDYTVAIEGKTIVETLDVDGSELNYNVPAPGGEGSQKGIYMKDCTLTDEVGVADTTNGIFYTFEGVNFDCAQAAMTFTIGYSTVYLKDCNLTVTDGAKIIDNNGVGYVQLLVENCKINGEVATAAAVKALCDGAVMVIM